MTGELSPEQPSFETIRNKELTDEMLELPAGAEGAGLMKVNRGFLLRLLRDLWLNAVAWLTLRVLGMSFLAFLLCAVLLRQFRPRLAG